MEVRILAKTDQEMRIIIDGINPQFANSLRRTMVGKIPILAMDDVMFKDNNSVLYDEVIAHRLGLIPLKFDTKAFTMKDDCNCDGKGCSNCEIVFVLDKKGPCTVVSGDLKSADAKAASSVYPDILIVELFEGQRLRLEATASLGVGRNNAKYQASITYFREYPSVSLDGKITNSDETAKICPKRALSFSGNKATVSIDCDLCGECVKIAQPEDVLKVNGDDTKYIFAVESVSGLSANDIFLAGTDILKKHVNEFSKKIAKVK